MPEKTQTQGIREKLVTLVRQAVEEVKKTGRPTSIELAQTEHFVLGLLVVPPRKAQYGATVIERKNVGVLLQVRSKQLWRNSLTFRQPEYIREVVELLNILVKNKELMDAVREVMTPVETTKATLVLEI